MRKKSVLKKSTKSSSKIDLDKSVILDAALQRSTHVLTNYMLHAAIPGLVFFVVFILCYFVLELSTSISLIISIATTIAVTSLMFTLSNNERKAMFVMADVIKKQNEKQAERLSTSVVKELRASVNTKTPVILNHFVKRRIEKRLAELGLLESANTGEGFEVIYSHEVTDENPSFNYAQQAFAENVEDNKEASNHSSSTEDDEKKKKSGVDCDLRDRDASGACVIYESGREEIDSRAIQPEEQKQDLPDPMKDYFESPQINPANGLPILENGLDMYGNPPGFDFEREKQEQRDRDESMRLEHEREQHALFEKKFAEEQRQIELQAIEIQRREEIERLLQADRERIEAERERENKRRFEEEMTTWGGYDSRY